MITRRCALTEPASTAQTGALLSMVRAAAQQNALTGAEQVEIIEVLIGALVCHKSVAQTWGTVLEAAFTRPR